jgi:hypothetical protein
MTIIKTFFLLEVHSVVVKRRLKKYESGFWAFSANWA